MNELDLFAAAIAVSDQGERASLLDRECAGRPDVRQRIDQLLDAHFRSHPLLDQPVPEVTGAYAPNEQPGAVIAGRYKLLEKIGEGGMGEVWVTEQTQPVRRKVALKLIKAGMDSKSVIARFEAERQALAVMDHPNVAKVLDGGLTESGRPFFVMEYVKGVPITEYCDAMRLSVPERLQLFTQVCQAVQHAHQKGIIHRDLKPSNILVAPYDDKPVPKIIDFGLAKAMHQSLTERTLHTAHDSVLGTPLYMSPEQAQLNNLDVDSRSDIYSLGVLLYELLTGTTPLGRKRFKEAAWDEIKRIIREEEPPRPSARLSSTDTLPSLAACRQTEPLKLTKQVRGELDWIVMKALEKDRTRRYETANGLARDVERYLADEVVEARPPTRGYRLSKFARKYKKVLATAAAFAVLLIAGLVLTSSLAVWATSAERDANRQRIAAEDAKGEALEAKAEADKQRDEARLKAYAAGMNLASRAWEDNIVPRARELLEEVPKSAAGRDLRGFEWYYLSRVCHSETRTLEGHTWPVLCVAFLDEIGELPSAVQAKLLRAIEQKEVQPVGANEPVHVEARVLAATNKDLKRETEEGRFRDDLFYRLNVVTIHLPPLRERREDIPELVTRLLNRHAQTLGKRIHGVTHEAMQLLMACRWRGNVRELDNALQRAAILGEGPLVTPADLPPDLAPVEGDPALVDDLGEAVKRFEKQHIERLLRQIPDKREAARRLGMGLSSLYRRIAELGIQMGVG